MTQNRYDPTSNAQKSELLSAEVMPRILLAEDDEEMRRLLVQALCVAGYEVIQCRDGMEFMGHLESFILDRTRLDFKLIISDILMPGLTGLEIFEDLHDFEGFPPMILITAFGDESTHRKAKQLGAAAMFDKPFDVSELLAKVHELLPTLPFLR